MEIDINRYKIKRLHSWMKLSFLNIFINKKRIRRILYKKKGREKVKKSKITSENVLLINTRIKREDKR